MDATLFANLLAYCAQIASITAIAAIVAVVVRIDAPAVRYAYWRAVLGLCLVLPWVQGREPVTLVPDGAATAMVIQTSDGISTATGRAVHEAAVSWLPAIGAILIVGMILRLMWLGVGLLHLRRLRIAGKAAPPCEEHEELQWIVRARAEIRYVAGLRQPVTFGALRPLILLPHTLRDRPVEIQRAVLCHELFHVRRRDWAWVLAEEVVRAAFWFHPAIWWLISRVQLTREEVVDDLAVLATGRRRTYIEALLTFADETPLAPASAFARRRHLFRRMMLISKEAAMSSRQVVLSCAVMALAVSGASWYTVDALPLQQSDTAVADLREAARAMGRASLAPQRGNTVVTASRSEPGPMERRAKPVTPENPVPRRIYSLPPQYPAAATATGERAIVTLRVTIDENGRVGEVRASNLGAVSPGLARFGPDGRTLVQPRSPEMIKAFADSAIQAVRQWQYNPPADGPIAFNVTLSFTPDADATLVSQDASVAPSGVVGGRGRSGAFPSGAAGPPPPPPPPPPPDWAQGAVRVGGAILQPTRIKNVDPIYPAIAQSARVQGVVIMETLIAADGRVSNARVVRSIPLLDQAALDAVMQWEFTPTLLNGVPVPVLMMTTVNFTLQ